MTYKDLEEFKKENNLTDDMEIMISTNEDERYIEVFNVRNLRVSKRNDGTKVLVLSSNFDEGGGYV